MLRNVLLTIQTLLMTAFIFHAGLTNSFEFNNKAEKSSYDYGAILQYHHVNTGTPAVTSISPDLFKQHLNLIESEGFSVLPLDSMIQSIKLGIPFKNKTLAITFDDNYRSIYDNAFPLLKEKNWPFTIFINPKTIRSNDHSNNTSFTLSWKQLIEMKKSGATIANHTQNHWHLLKQDLSESDFSWRQRIQKDIESAQSMLEKNLGEAPKWVAYPYGEFNTRLKELMANMGYLGFSQQSGGINQTTNWQSIPRFPASGIYSNMDTLKTKIHSQPFEIYSESPKNKIRVMGNPAPTLELIVNKDNVIYSQLSCYFEGSKIYTEITENKQRLVINAQLEGTLPFGRSRYNCTAPSKMGHYLWYSMPFITTTLDGEWQD